MDYKSIKSSLRGAVILASHTILCWLVIVDLTAFQGLGTETPVGRAIFPGFWANKHEPFLGLTVQTLQAQ
jgi:hypothetical protein